jgi:hypothetical protein
MPTMDGATFDRLTRLGAGKSRRDLVRLLIAAWAASALTPVRVARGRLPGAVVLGGACSGSVECRQQEMQAAAICVDNGFASDGRMNCCVASGCCASDADCCGDLRCAPTPDVCSVCLQPPFPTRFVGQICAGDADCVPAPSVDIACVAGRCACLGPEHLCALFGEASVADVPAAEAALMVAEELSRLEVAGRFASLYELMHPDARAIIPVEAVTGWYRDASAVVGAPAAEAIKVRFISWMWEVNGKTYHETAEVAVRQTLSDGTVIRDEVRLVQDEHGNWSWFFGRDRAFVEKQIARYG